MRRTEAGVERRELVMRKGLMGCKRGRVERRASRAERVRRVRVRCVEGEGAWGGVLGREVVMLR